MKKKDIWIALGIIAVSLVSLFVYTHRTGYVRLETGGVQASLDLTHSFFRQKTILSDRNPSHVPARVYHPKYFRLFVKRDNRVHSLESSGPWGELNTLNVSNGQTTIVRLGPPFCIQTVVYENDPVVREIDFVLSGQAGERYKPDRAMNPGIRIIDESGNCLNSGVFRFG